MLRHKNIDRLCCIVLAFTLLLTGGFMGAAATGLISGERSIGYENRLFDQSRVHTIDIVMDDWDAFLATCAAEEYSACTIIIDGESYGSVGIRGKGNTSLSSVQSYGNDRYSFKVEFDQYQTGKTYHGLDKLSLNNLIQDKTYMKDYIAYTLMNRMGVAAPLCSFVQISVNGEPWGLYLAVEGVEDSFLKRNYGSDSGELYKPDSMSFGGGRGNGRDFDMEAFSEQFEESEGNEQEAFAGFDPSRMGGFDPGSMGGFDSSQMGGFDPSQMGSFDFSGKGGFDPSQMFGGGKGGFGMGSSDVMLQYTDDDPASYSNIFNNAKTDTTEADRQRLIESLKVLSEGDQIESVVDTDAVLRYLVVHNFLCNDDSYTGMMVHNYYLYEEDGVLSMIPWDYNLAFGGFSMGGMGGSGATSTINSPIDSPVSTGDVSSRPMVAWIFESEEYTARYHELYAQFIADIFDSGWMTEEIARVSEMIAPYVEQELRAFFTYDEFRNGVSAMAEFCDLRAQSIAGQLDGTIPSTTQGQRTDSSALIDGSNVDLSAMGEFGMGGGRGGMDFGGGMPQWSNGDDAAFPDMSGMKQPFSGGSGEMSSSDSPFGGGMMMPGMQMMGGMAPNGMTMPGMSGQQSEGMPSGNGFPNMPSGAMNMSETPSGMMKPPQMGEQAESQMDAATAATQQQANLPQEAEDKDVQSDIPDFSGIPTNGIGNRTDDRQEILWLAITLTVLGAAILFAKFYKSNR